MPAPTRICSVCACSSGSIASSPTQTNSRPGSFIQTLDHVVERVLHPRLQRNQPFLRRLLAQGLAGGAVDLAHEGRNRHREGVADDARQPLVVLIFQRWLAGLDQRGAGASELAALGMIGSRGLSDHGTPFSAKICSSASMKAGFSLSSCWSGDGKCAPASLPKRSVPETWVPFHRNPPESGTDSRSEWRSRMMPDRDIPCTRRR